MATHDPRRDLPSPTSPGEDGVREPTQSLSIGPYEQDQDSPSSLARGTHNRPVTQAASPAARGRTSAPHARAASHGHTASHDPTDPTDYIDAVLGSYRVIELVGKGGMGHVYRAEHVKLGREVALKLLRSDYASRRDAVARFFQEARTVNRIRHRNIVDVTDFVELDDGTTYIVMELLSGTSLGAWGQTGVDLPRTLAVLIQICDGLAAAHQVGVVHRDLKPDNVIVVPTPDGAELVKLLDFGVAKLLNRDDEDVGFQTAAGSVIGTPAYMSPEQAGGMVIDARSDIYSLGAIMYELFCCQPMFRGRSFGEYVRKHLTEVPTPPRQTVGGAAIDPVLEALILRCLEKDPDQRFGHISELREALLQLLASVGGALELFDSAARRARISGVPGPPGAGLPGASGTRLHSGPFPLMPPAPTPLPSASVSAPGASGIAGVSGPYAPPAFGARSYPPAPVPVPSTRHASGAPAWVWFAGGAAAVGVGIAAAIWYAGRDVPPLPSSSAPSGANEPAAATAQPIQPPTAQPIEPPTARPQLVEVRFDSLPSGGVFAEGGTAELCRTPCAFNIDPADGGPTDHRVFVIRRTDYVDSPVTVDLTGGRREFQVLLQRVATDAAATARAEARSHDARPGKAETTERRPGKRPAKPRKDASRSTRDDGDGANRPAEPAEPRPAATQPIPPAPAPVPSIDPADTLDPFRKK